jgi:oligopeptide/dipeptide ABC transporter ATP-binding protein
MSALLEVAGLHVRYRTAASLSDILARRPRRFVHAVNGVGFSLGRGDTLGLVGESGCGKSTLGRAILRLTESSAGSVRFDGEDILKLPPAELLRFRRRAQIVFQDPYASLNPRRTVAATLGEIFSVHRLCDPREVEARVRELMARVGLPTELADRRAGGLSGGQCQRVGIARALAMGAELIVADEPVSALDVSIQAQILNLLAELQGEFGLTYLFIAHDLNVVRHVSDRIAVMYLGKIVELSPADELHARPVHPYTEALLSAVPTVETDARERRRGRIVLRGDPPSPVAPPTGCRFHTRCRFATEICSAVEPPLVDHGGGHLAACHHPLDGEHWPTAQARRAA